jgi:CDP-paratose 2-epimerase
MNIIITGGAGFIGSNASKYFLSHGDNVVIFDNLSRAGVEKNLEWLKSLSNKPEIIKGEIRDQNQVDKLRKYLVGADLVLHLAAQVAVTSSVVDPRNDFEVNALGTFNLLEVLRKSSTKAKCIYTSTNKVYGGMENLKIIKQKTRYSYKDFPEGISEQMPLDFHSPYGCSKGSADQYFHDYSRIYGLDSTVCRQSCIYGPRQFGVEDQGWVAWFIIALTLGKKITIYGDGLQVRDLLYIYDLIECYDLILQQKEKTRGEIYNIGGGMKNTISVWSEFKPILESLFKNTIIADNSKARPGDQTIYVSDIRKVKRDIGWIPKTDLKTGIKKLYNWVKDNKSLFN